MVEEAAVAVVVQHNCGFQIAAVDIAVVADIADDTGDVEAQQVGSMHNAA